jgi:hypothetical protein
VVRIRSDVLAILRGGGRLVRLNGVARVQLIRADGEEFRLTKDCLGFPIAALDALVNRGLVKADLEFSDEAQTVYQLA